MKREKEYFKNSTTVSFVKYHFIFCPKYRRKIFLIPGVDKRFKELTYKCCEDLKVEIISLECKEDHIHLVLKCWPDQAPVRIMKEIKGASSHTLRNEFSQLSGMSSLWTKNFFVTTEREIDNSIITWYVNTQKTRG